METIVAAIAEAVALEVASIIAEVAVRATKSKKRKAPLYTNTHPLFVPLLVYMDLIQIHRYKK